MKMLNAGSLFTKSSSVGNMVDFSSGVLLELGEFVLQHSAHFTEKGLSTNEINNIITSIKLAAKVVNRLTTKHSSFAIDDTHFKRMQTEEMSELRGFSNKAFLDAVQNRGSVAGVATSVSNGFIEFPGCENKSMVLLVHSMDGTRLVDVNVSSGTIFSLYKRVTPLGTPVTEMDFLQSGENQICAGYVLYGSSTILVCTFGKGVFGFTLDPSLGTFYMSHANIRVPTEGSYYSVNGGKSKLFPIAVRNYIDYCQNKGIACRYIGSLVADFHRNMLKGGIYIYPPTFTDPIPSVSMSFQCFPLAFIAEQAGGKASDGFTRVLLIEPVTLTDRIPFFCGSLKMVETLELFMAKNKMRDGGWFYRSDRTA